MILTPEGVAQFDDSCTVTKSRFARFDFAAFDSNLQVECMKADFCANISDSLVLTPCNHKESQTDLESEMYKDTGDRSEPYDGAQTESVTSGTFSGMTLQTPPVSNDKVNDCSSIKSPESREEPEGERLPEAEPSPRIKPQLTFEEKSKKKTHISKKTYSRRIVSKRKRLISATLDLFDNDSSDDYS
eukprot:CAMPEP_0204826594 /NCGR_PEP_ID=MMETSP1346-20131115/4253_1 /ASSEMBLY_ACC=CAM_ASM_000771 /TAXON_ID=215587 /ORGANISM="Aplanochytrium stocchinoi, Strain GSBS06" /LENGTH=186 /DNA_ID=CAMNT_0051954687 /DNA_START=340 /DNA_END=900 /DNA_ORIENTATION=+